MDLGPYVDSRIKYVIDWNLGLGPLPQLEDLVTHAQAVGPLEVKALEIGLTILVDPHTDLDALVDAFTDSPNEAVIGPCVPDQIAVVVRLAQWLLQNPDQPQEVIDALCDALPPDGHRDITNRNLQVLIHRRNREEALS